MFLASIGPSGEAAKKSAWSPRSVRRGLKKIAEFYQKNEKVINAYRVRTLDFSGGHTQRCYTRAKVIDMALSTEGERLIKQADELAKLAKLAAAQNKLGLATFPPAVA